MCIAPIDIFLFSTNFAVKSLIINDDDDDDDDDDKIHSSQ